MSCVACFGEHGVWAVQVEVCGVDGWLIEPKTPEFHEIRKGMIGRFHDQ